MFIRQIKKEIYQFSAVELLELIEDSNDKDVKEKAINELKNKNLSDIDLRKAKSEYEIYKQYKQKRIHASLSAAEFFLCFFMPIKFMDASDDYTQEEINKYSEYGFTRKKNQAIKVRFLGIIFYIIIASLIYFSYIKI